MQKLIQFSTRRRCKSCCQFGQKLPPPYTNPLYSNKKYPNRSNMTFCRRTHSIAALQISNILRLSANNKSIICMKRIFPIIPHPGCIVFFGLKQNNPHQNHQLIRHLKILSYTWTKAVWKVIYSFQTALLIKGMPDSAYPLMFHGLIRIYRRIHSPYR